jgi:hypothetical protein
MLRRSLPFPVYQIFAQFVISRELTTLAVCLPPGLGENQFMDMSRTKSQEFEIINQCSFKGFSKIRLDSSKSLIFAPALCCIFFRRTSNCKGKNKCGGSSLRSE